MIKIKLSVPDIRKNPALRRIIRRARRLNRRQRFIVAATTLIVLIALASTLVTQLRQHRPSTVAGAGVENPLDKLERGTPTYRTILPEGKSVDELGGWTRISPSNRDPVFAYVDRIGTTTISVSQQPLPPSFSGKPDDKVRDLAFANNANRSLQSADTTIYVGSSTDGPQSVFFYKNDVLVLIKSSTTVSDSEWKTYIQSLQ